MSKDTKRWVVTIYENDPMVGPRHEYAERYKKVYVDADYAVVRDGGISFYLNDGSVHVKDEVCITDIGTLVRSFSGYEEAYLER